MMDATSQRSKPTSGHPQPNAADHKIPSVLNTALAVLLILVHLLPLWMMEFGRNALWIALALLVLMTPTLWSLIHEGIHGHLLPNRANNDALARLLSICFGTPFRLARFGHLLHHRHNRTGADQVEVYDESSSTWLQSALVFYPRLIIGLYLAEWLANLLAFLPRSLLLRLLPRLYAFPDEEARVTAEQELFSKRSLAQLRLDALGIVVLYGILFYGLSVVQAASAGLLVLALLARGVLVSVLDNSYHYDTPLNDKRDSLNFRLPIWLSYWFLHFPMHRTHHHYPALPWVALPRFTHYETRDPSLLIGALAQFKGPLPLRRFQ